MTSSTKGEGIFQIKRWLGLNESEDGDTRLKLGVAAQMRNWKITNGGSLQIRPGTKTLFSFTGAVRGLWSGNVAGAGLFVWSADPTRLKVAPVSKPKPQPDPHPA